MKTIHFSLSDKQHAKLKATAKAKGMTMAALIRASLPKVIEPPVVWKPTGQQSKAEEERRAIERILRGLK